jgi:hypothetical protein
VRTERKKCGSVRSHTASRPNRTSNVLCERCESGTSSCKNPRADQTETILKPAHRKSYLGGDYCGGRQRTLWRTSLWWLWTYAGCGPESWERGKPPFWLFGSKRPAKLEKAPDTETDSPSDDRAKQGTAGTAGVGGQRRVDATWNACRNAANTPDPEATRN